MPSKVEGDLVDADDWNRIGDNFSAIVPFEVVAIFDGGTAAISTGTAVDIPIDFKASVADLDVFFTAIGGTTDYVSILILSDSQANFPPVADDDFMTPTSDGVTVYSSDGLASAPGIASWTKTEIAAGDVIRFYVSGCSLAKKVTVRMSCNRSS
jgi:hypothetical protein